MPLSHCFESPTTSAPAQRRHAIGSASGGASAHGGSGVNSKNMHEFVRQAVVEKTRNNATKSSGVERKLQLLLTTMALKQQWLYRMESSKRTITGMRRLASTAHGKNHSVCHNLEILYLLAPSTSYASLVVF